jgi:hypothetical protein
VASRACPAACRHLCRLGTHNAFDGVAGVPVLLGQPACQPSWGNRRASPLGATGVPALLGQREMPCPTRTRGASVFLVFHHIEYSP